MAYVCPFCGVASTGEGTKKTLYESFEKSGVLNVRGEPGALVLYFEKCLNCGKIQITLRSLSSAKDGDFFYFSYPPSGTMALPEYIPSAIRRDYTEAMSIANLSPKAAATLARRCLQGMIHDFWGIKEKNLNAEITALNGKVPASQWKAIDGLRKVGNIGAHMEKDVELIIDVEPEEAKKLLKLIELLIQKWYVARHDEEELFAEITSIATEKEDERTLLPVNSDSQQLPI